MLDALVMSPKFAHSELSGNLNVRCLRDDFQCWPSHTANMLSNNTFGATLRAHRKTRGWTQDQLAAEADTSKGYISDLEAGKRPMPPGATVERIAKALDVSVKDLVSGPEGDTPALVRVIGQVGADSSGSVVMTTAHDSWDMVPPAPGATSKAVALDVRGDSMHTFAENGALIYFEDQRAPLDPELIGVPCVVETEDGRVLVKRPKRGSEPGLYDLESDFGPVIRDVRLAWAAEVIAVIPPRQARRIIIKASDAA